MDQDHSHLSIKAKEVNGVKRLAKESWLSMIIETKTVYLFQIYHEEAPVVTLQRKQTEVSLTLETNEENPEESTIPNDDIPVQLGK